MRICEEVVQIICAALADLGATIHTVDVVYGRKTETTPDMTTKRQEFYGYYVNRRLGTGLKKEEFSPLLARMGLGFEEGRIKETYYALLPPYRVDFLHQVDVVEDVAIAIGYENVSASLPNTATIASLAPSTKLHAVLRKALVGQGLLEAKNYHLISKAFQLSFDGNPDMVLLKSSVSEEHDALRSSLLSSMVQMFSRNKLHEYPQGFFEIGTVFSPAADKVIERSRLAIGLAGETDYTRIRQSVDNLLLAFGLTGSYVAVEDIRFLKGRCSQVSIDGVQLGVLGEVSPRVLAHSQLVVPVAAAELDVDALAAIVLK
jgi:phenylalanyl-tRNA synthetase beta chain